MMPEQTQPAAELRFDAASGLAAGQRETQQDAVASDFPLGTGFGLAVLADGMGGHVAGDVAARIVVTEVFSDLKLRGPGLGGRIPAALRLAAEAANGCIRAHADQNGETEGMGSTLVALTFDGDRLHWLSIGDSLLLLWRGGMLKRMNEDHSLAGQIEWLVETGRMDAETGRNHPDRHVLTSCLHGAQIERIDCPDTPEVLLPGDLVLVASDGLETLSRAEIAGILTALGEASAQTVVAALLEAVAAVDDPQQDNVSITAVRMLDGPVPMPWQTPAEPGRRGALQGMARLLGARLMERRVEPERSRT